MSRLFGYIYILAGSVLAGVAVTALLTMKMDSAAQISMGAIAGAIAAIPLAWIVAGKLAALK
ncbi:MAG: hypothetical protein WAT78_12230 [Rhizobiaceae bacterium]